MKIVLSIHHYLNRNAGAAGVTLRVADLLKGLGHQVDVLGFEILGRNWGETPNQVRFPTALARAVARLKPDIWDASTGDAVRGGPRGVRIITRSHGLEHLAYAAKLRRYNGHLALKTRWYQGQVRLKAVQRAMENSSAILVLNQAEKLYVTTQLGIPANRVYLTLNPVDPRFFTVTAKPQTPFRVLMVGALETRKGTLQVLQAMQALWENGQRPHFTCVGQGELQSEVEVQLRQAPAGLVEYHRLIPNPELPDLMANSSCLVLASDFEGAPGIMAEALATGLPVIATRVGNAPDVLEGTKAGVLLENRHPETIAHAIRKLMEAPEPAQQAMCDEAKRVGRQFTAERVVQSLMNVYKSV